MTASTAPPAAAEPVPRRWVDRLPTVTAVWATVHVALGVWWLLDPSAWPFRPGESPSSPTHLLSPSLSAALFTAVAAVGLLTALAMRRDATSTGAGSRRLLLTVAVVQAALFSFAVPDVRALMFLGYLMAVATPVGLLTLAVVGSVRHWQIRILALAIVGVGVLALATGWADAGILTGVGVGIVTGVVTNGLDPLYVFAILAGGILWAGMSVRYFRQGRGRCLSCGRPGARWTRPDDAARWGRRVTLVAVLCPLPYALMRFSWLTPWPIGMDAGDLAADPAIRLFGVFLGSGAVLGSVLTSGLVSRWGERWPFWMPLLAGRPIPWPVAVVPAGVVTVALLAASQSMGAAIVESALAGRYDEVLHTFAFPFAPWAVTLGAATLAYYYYRRRGRCTTCGLR